MICKINLADLIAQESQRQGVDPAIALAVARQESGVCQWRMDGSVVTSSSGAIGVMQLMPATAAGLGVDPYDVDQNIRGGVTYLKQLYQKYGSWDRALAAYNWGPQKVDSSSARGSSFPGDVINYVKAILGIRNVFIAANNGKPDAAASAVSAADVLSKVLPQGRVPMTAVVVLGAVAIGAYMLMDD